MAFPSPLDDYSSEALLRAAEQQIRERQPLQPLDLVDLTKAALSLLKALDLTGTTIALTDMSQLRGNYHVHRALEVAAAGNHPILLVGYLSAGKATMIRCLPTLLPERERREVMALTAHQERAIVWCICRFAPTCLWGHLVVGTPLWVPVVAFGGN